MILNPYIDSLIQEQNRLGGINITKLKPQTKLIVSTRWSTYHLEITDKPNWLKCSGGKYFPEEELVFFPGSTFGGSVLKQNWIGKDMHMEFKSKGVTITTSRVLSVVVVGDDWSYRMQWD